MPHVCFKDGQRAESSSSLDETDWDADHNQTVESDVRSASMKAFPPTNLLTLFFADTSTMKFRSRFSVAGSEVQWHRLSAYRIVYGRRGECLSGTITLVNFILILWDTDITASEEQTPTGIVIVNYLCLGYFSIELLLRAMVERYKLFSDYWNWLDIVVVCSGILQAAFEIVGTNSIPVGPMRTLRCFRLLRILRAFSLLSNAKHLRSIVRSIAVCLKILAWALVIVFIFMTLWATLSVEMLRPLMVEINERSDAWSDCSRCVRAFDSVMAANLTLFQVVIAGDSWGLVAIPVIEAYPQAAVIFVGCLFTVSLGILNLVIAVLVDAAAEARAGDTEMRAVEAERNETSEKKYLGRLFKILDTDSSGSVSFEELQEGSKAIPELKQMLQTMDIQGEELNQLFLMLDEDGSGEIDPSEFIDTLHRLKNGDNKTAATFVKQYVLHMKKNQVDLQQSLAAVKDQIKRLSMFVDGRRRDKRGTRNMSGNGEREFRRQKSNDAILPDTGIARQTSCQSNPQDFSIFDSELNRTTSLQSSCSTERCSLGSLDLDEAESERIMRETGCAPSDLLQQAGVRGSVNVLNFEQLIGLIARISDRLSLEVRSTMNSQLRGIQNSLMQEMRLLSSRVSQTSTAVQPDGECLSELPIDDEGFSKECFFNQSESSSPCDNGWSSGGQVQPSQQWRKECFFNKSQHGDLNDAPSSACHEGQTFSLQFEDRFLKEPRTADPGVTPGANVMPSCLGKSVFVPASQGLAGHPQQVLSSPDDALLRM